MRKKIKNIGLDLDGCIFPFTENFTEYAEEKLKRKLPVPQSFEIAHWWNISNTRFNEIYQSFILEDGFSNQPYEYSSEVTKELKKLDYNIFIITHRIFPEFNSAVKVKSVESTTSWLEYNNIQYDNLLFLKEKFLMNVDLLVDDAVHNLQAAVISNTIPICVDQPWNQDWKGHRISNIRELPEYLKTTLPEYLTIS